MVLALRELTYEDRQDKKYSFPHRIVDTRNGLREKVVTATNIHKFKEMLDIWRYGDRTL